MREILFRGKVSEGHWNVDLRGKWVEGNLVHQTEYYGSPVDRYHILYTGEFHCDYYDSAEVIPETISQFTGLTDKSGKKIFEGDIIVIRNCREHPVLVKFIEFSWQCVIPNVDAYIHYRHRLENNDTKYEVIGNIHDNPELLEGK